MTKKFFYAYLLLALLFILYESGCVQGRVSDTSAEITYAQAIHPVITRRCTPCHRPGQSAPFSLLKYSDVKLRAAMIKEVINGGTMPPWPADTSYSRFLNEQVLTASEKKLINRWIDEGMKPGDTMRIKPTAELVLSAGRKPDYVFSLPKKYLVAPKEADQFARFRIITGLDEDIEVTGFEFVPGNRKAVHHAELLSNSPSDLVKKSEEDTLKMFVTYSYEGAGFFRGYEYITGWLPGTGMESLPVGVVKKLSAKDDYIFLIHYPPSPVVQTDSTVLHVFKSQKKADRYLESVELHGAYHIENGPLILLPNTVKTFHAKRTVEQDFSAFAILPHAHHLCKRMLAYAVTPAKDTIQLLRINNWDFDWQYTYKFPRYVKLQAGTVVHFIATYDNTMQNPENPYNPPRMIYSSFNANDEMMELFLLGVAYREGDENQSIKYDLE